MNIALLSTSYFPEYNGASIRVDGLAQGLTELGHTVFILVPGTTLLREVTDHAVVWRIPVSRSLFSRLFEKLIKFHSSRFFSFLKHLDSIIRTEKIDLIHTRQPLDLFMVGYCLRKKVPWTTEVHKFQSVSDYENGLIGALRRDMLLYFERSFMNASDLVVTMTDSGKTTLQNHGIRRTILPVSNASSMTNKKTPSPFPGKRYILYAGNLRASEGIDGLLRSFALVHRTMPELSCVIIGGGDVKKWKEYAQKLSLGDSVLFLGELPFEKLAPYYHHALFFFHPRKNTTYHRDIIGLKFYDALRCGLPFVTSDVGEMATLIRKHNVGVVSRGDDGDCAEKIITTLRQPKTLAQLKKNALNTSKLFSWKQSCTLLSKAYQHLLEKRHV